ncbi:MAG: phage head spike fiber domain-containing protein [Shewanella sp.]
MASDLEKAVSNINDAATKANITTDFFTAVLDGNESQTVTNPVSGKSCPSLKKQINDRFTADSSQLNSLLSQATSQANRAKSEADRASQISGLDTVEQAVSLAAIPFPDVWIPLSDSLRVLAGYGREVKVGDDVVANYATLTRNSAATMVNKSLSLAPVAINEARFEREGLLVERKSTNVLSKNWGSRTSQSNNTSVKNSDGSYSHTAKGTSNIICSPSRDMIAPATEYTASVYYSASRTKLTKHGIRFQFAYVNNWVDNSFVLVDTRTNTIKGKSGNIVNESITVKGDLVIITMTTTSNGVVDPSGGSLDVYTYDVDSGSSASVTSTDGDVFTEHGFQLEASILSSSLIPTNGAAVTRADDKLTIPRLNNDCAEWYSGSDPITPIVTAGTIELVPPAGKKHLRNVRGFFTPLTPAQKAALK